MGEITQKGVVSVSKHQRKVTVKFPRAFKEEPKHLALVAIGMGGANKVSAASCSRRSFKVELNTIPLIEHDIKLDWEATGEVDSALFALLRSAVAIGGMVGGLVGFYAVLVGLHWVPNILAAGG